MNLEDLKDATNNPIVPAPVPTPPPEPPVILPGMPPSVAHSPEVSDSEDILAGYIPDHFSKSRAQPAAEQLMINSATQDAQELGWEIVTVEEAPVVTGNGHGANWWPPRRTGFTRTAANWTREWTRR